MKKTYKRIFIELDRGNKTEGKRKKPKKRFLYRTYMILILLLLTAVVSAVCLTVLYSKRSTEAGVSDTEAPACDIHSFDILLGEEISDDDIVNNITDNSEVTVEFLRRADFKSVGEHTVRVRLTDAFGNSAEYISYIRVHDINKEITAEISSSNATLAELIFNDEWSKSNMTMDNDALKGLGLGEHSLTLNGKYNSISVSINIVDTTPPVFSLQSKSCLIGSDPLPTDFVLSCSDATDVTYAFKSVPDTSKKGTFQITVIATDTSGNVSEETTVMTVTASERFCLNVANIMQKPELPNGCEVVSLAIALKYAGYNIDPVELYDEYMPKSPLKNGDPWTTYVGDAKGRGYGCYAPCVVTTGNEYLASIGSSKKVKDVSGQSLSYYEDLVAGGTPVIMWGTIKMNGNSSLCWEATINGKYVNWHNYSHCLVLIGYTDDTYIFCDPLEGIAEYTKSSVEASFLANYKQACIVQ